MTVFGTIITATYVRRAMRDTIQRWIPDYLAEIADQYDKERGALPTFRSYISRPVVDRFPEDQLPCCVIVAPGTLDEPDKRPDAYDAAWALGVAAVIGGRTVEESFELAELYAGAIRTLVVHHPSLGGVVDSTRWAGERYDEYIDPVDARTQASCTLQFNVAVNNVVDLASGGPAAPSEDVTAPPDDVGTVQAVVIETNATEELV